MYLKFNILVISFLFALNDGKQFRFDYDFYREADGWMKLHRIPATWSDARLRCFREGAVLASPESEHLLWSMTSLLQHKQVVSRGVFSGISSTYSKGDFYSITGTPLSRMPVRWTPDEPDNADNAEDCLLMLPDGTFADVNCSNVYPYICYRGHTNTTVLTQCGTVDTGYTLDSRTGSCYKFHTEPQTWPRAFLACSGEGGYLAIINSVTESKVLSEVYGEHPADSTPGGLYVVHIGHTNWGENRLFMTVHGQTLKEAGFAEWSEGDPNGVTIQNCGAMYRYGQFDDVDCDSVRSFICEKSPDSLLPDDEELCRPICKSRRREWMGLLQDTSAELLLERKPKPDCLRRCPMKLYPNSPCPLLARSKKVIIHERNAVHTPRVVRICQAPLDLHVDTPYLTYMEMAKRLGAWQMVDRISCGICSCGACCDCAAPRYEPRDAERAGRRRAHMREFDARVRTDYQMMRIMYDNP